MGVVILDTSSLIRFFTRDDEKKAAKVAKLLKSDQEKIIPDVVFPEIEYVLESIYQATRQQIARAFSFLIQQPSIQSSSEVKRACALFDICTLDMADCIILAAAEEQAEVELEVSLASFDHKMIKHSSVQSLWKAT